MRNFFSNNTLTDFSAFLASVIFVILLLLSFIWFNNSNDKKIENKTLTLTHPSINQGVIHNYETGIPAELTFLSSIGRQNQLTLMGSSEFSENPFASFQFLPNELGFAAVGFGHAHHQNFSILCEMLAANTWLPKSKVVIFLSPGWFETDGTNSEAFLEFVPPHFLEKIWMDQSIEETYKIEIGRFIAENEANFSGMSYRMQSFLNLYLAKVENNWTKQLRIKLEKSNPNWSNGTHYTYLIRQNPIVAQHVQFAFDEKKKELGRQFLKQLSNNNMYIDSSYFRQNLLNTDGTVKTGTVTSIDVENNREYKDFLLLLELFKKRNVDCSFVIQGLNPYYYSDLSKLNPLIRSLVNELDKANFPYINMFTTNKREYQPGTLSDVMHLGDLGWMKINEFIYTTYFKKK